MLIQLSDASIPPLLRESLLVDRLHIPRYWVTVWAVLKIGALAHNTRVQKLRYIESLYVHVEGLDGPGALDDILGGLDMDVLGNVLESFFVSLRNRSNQSYSAETQWRTAYEFVKDVISWLMQGSESKSLSNIDQRLLRLDTLYQQLHVQKSKHSETLRSLPANVIEAMYELLDPESLSNPFSRVKTRWMVYVIFIMLLHQGMRRGELLLQLVDSVKNNYDKNNRQHFWLNIANLSDEIEDPRFSRPSIKTVSSIRQIPVSEFTANIVQTYTENYRGRCDHPFLFNSAKNTPLSMEGLSKIFERITGAIPKNVMQELYDRTGNQSISPHDLRHTSSVVRLNQLLSSGVPMDEAVQKLRSFFGWSRTSDMPQKYAKAVFEDRLAGIWSNVLDDRVEILRAIPKGK